jgi:hypothetical protein
VVWSVQDYRRKRGRAEDDVDSGAAATKANRGVAASSAPAAQKPGRRKDAPFRGSALAAHDLELAKRLVAALGVERLAFADFVQQQHVVMRVMHA